MTRTRTEDLRVGDLYSPVSMPSLVYRVTAAALDGYPGRDVVVRSPNPDAIGRTGGIVAGSEVVRHGPAHWTWDPVHREYRLRSSEGTSQPVDPDTWNPIGDPRPLTPTRLRHTFGGSVVLVPGEANIIVLTADELDEAATIARCYRDTGVFGEGGGS